MKIGYLIEIATFGLVIWALVVCNWPALGFACASFVIGVFGGFIVIFADEESKLASGCFAALVRVGGIVVAVKAVLLLIGGAP